MACSEKIIDERPTGKKGGGKGYTNVWYTNPVIRNNCADPDVFDDRERSGYFYAFSTQNGNTYMPIYRSTDMVSWEYVTDAFAGDKPDWLGADARTWAPNIKYIGGQYVLYFAEGLIGSSMSGTGVAHSNSPTGPFRWRDLPNKGCLMTNSTMGMVNMIDPCYYVDRATGKPYLFIGSFGSQCLWAFELKSDGLSFVKDPTVSSNRIKYAQGIEGTDIIYYGGYYYLFGSTGSCCEGKESTYHIVVARSQNLLGPYTLKDGTPLLDYTWKTQPDANTILQNPSAEIGKAPYFAGVGHNASVIVDDADQYWMCYHAYWADNNYNGRTMCMDQIFWKDGWPSFRTGNPSQTRTQGPSFKLTTKSTFTASDNEGAGPLLVTEGDPCGTCRSTWAVPENRYSFHSSQL